MMTTPMSLPPLDLVDKLFGFVDRPWKIAAVVVLALGGVVAWTLWEYRGQLAEAYIGRYLVPRLESGRFTAKFAAELGAETRADLVELAEISLHKNLIRNLDGWRRGEAGWRPESNARPIFYTARDPQFLINLIEGRPICHDLPDGNEEEKALAAQGMKRRCVIAVPPVLGQLVGGLSLAWRQPLSAEAEAGAGRLLYQAAARLATW